MSTEEQSTDDHYSLEYQEEKARIRVKEKGWQLVKVRKDVGSGKDSNREGYRELLSDIRSRSIDVVVVYKLDRLSRNVKDIYHFLDLIREHRVELVSLCESFDTTTPMGRAMLGVAAVFAQLTRETIAENTRNGMIQRAKRGKWNGGNDPYGYDYVKGGSLVVNPAEAATVKRIFDLFVNRKMSASKIARLLNLEKVPTKTGAEWSVSLVTRLLKNPLVIGKVQFDGKLYDGTHQPIVDLDLYEAAQERLMVHKKVHHRTLTSKFLLSGVARCAKCGCLLQTRHKDASRKFYVCRGNERVSSDRACGGLSKSARILDWIVVQRIREVATSPEMQQMSLEEAQKLLQLELAPSREERDRLVMELDELASAFTKWADRLDRGLIDEEQFRLQNSRLLAKKKQIQERLAELDEAISREDKARADFEAVREVLRDFDRLWEAATLEERQEMVRLLVERIEVSPDEMVLKFKFRPEERIPLPRGLRGKASPLYGSSEEDLLRTPLCVSALRSAAPCGSGRRPKAEGS